MTAHAMLSALVLATPHAQEFAVLPGGTVGARFLLHDWSVDGRLDVLAWSWMAESERGVLWFWNGTTLTGRRAPDLTLRVPGAQAGDQLGR